MTKQLHLPSTGSRRIVSLDKLDPKRMYDTHIYSSSSKLVRDRTPFRHPIRDHHLVGRCYGYDMYHLKMPNLYVHVPYSGTVAELACKARDAMATREMKSFMWMC